MPDKPLAVTSLAKELQKGLKMEETSIAWFPVNCCCQPDVLFGFIFLPADGQKFIDGQKFVIFDQKRRPHEVELKRLVNILDPGGTKPYVRQQEMAIYSDDRPIEFWRTIPGFREVMSEQRLL